MWGQGATIEIFAPSQADDPAGARVPGALSSGRPRARCGSSSSFEMFLDTDVRDALPLIHAPTLVMHRRGDRAVNVRAGRWLAEQIEGSRYVELEGVDHSPWVGATASGRSTRSRSSSPASRPARRPTASSRPSSSPTSSTRPGSRPRWATAAGATLLGRHQELVRRHLERFGGPEIKTTGDGFLATFDGPTRAVECARAIVADAPSIGIEVRAGMHTGEVELIGDDVGGIAVHVAARISALAEGRTVLVSRTVRDLVAGLRDRVRPLRPPLPEGRPGRVGGLHGDLDAALRRPRLSARGTRLGHREQAQESGRLAAAPLDPNRA